MTAFIINRSAMVRVIPVVSVMIVVASAVASAVASPSAPAMSVPACDGRWHEVPSPETTGRSTLNAVVAISPRSAWAVGTELRRTEDTTLIERWNGSRWTRVPSPDLPGSSALTDVAASSDHDVWAVGYRDGPQHIEGLVEHFDGSRWTIVGVPNARGIRDVPIGVAVASPSDVWFVGRRYPVGARESEAALTEHFDGSSWTIVPSHVRSIGLARLTSVAIVSASDAWAVGYRSHGEGFQALALHWDGSSWTTTPTPSLGSSRLAGVTVRSSGEPLAVGDVAGEPLSEVWDGASWAAQPIATVGLFSTLTSAANAGNADAWAVGWRFGHVSGTRSLIERWDGMSWTRVPSPTVGVADMLNGVSGAGERFWAVGSTQDEYGGTVRTLIEGYCWSGSPVTA
jgi:hypothetical protein